MAREFKERPGEYSKCDRCDHKAWGQKRNNLLEWFKYSGKQNQDFPECRAARIDYGPLFGMELSRRTPKVYLNRYIEECSGYGPSNAQLLKEISDGGRRMGRSILGIVRGLEARLHPK